MSQKIFKHIIIESVNYEKLKQLGKAGDSFNDVISKILNEKVAKQ